MIESTNLIYSVSQLCRETRLLLEGHFLTLSIEGEISNLAKPASGHIYFSLKDSKAQIQCAMFRPQLRKAGFNPENGQQVVLKARVSLYEQRGNFQLIAEHIEPVGEGLLRQRFEQLKNKLFQEGLFDQAHKQALPSLPEKIALITSSSGAAVHDVLTVLNKRFPLIPVLIYPTTVQGSNAKKDVVQALELANSRQECDVIILTRGGGSLEDLWTFNEETVARAIFASQIPVISAIGHEVDSTIADFVADQRAPTPSAAAEAVSPEQNDYLDRLEGFKYLLAKTIQNKLAQSNQQLALYRQQLESFHPGRQLQFHAQRLDDCSQRLLSLPRNLLQKHLLSLASLNARLAKLSPQQTISNYQLQLDALQQRLILSIQKQLNHSKIRLTRCSSTLDALSPLATLARGYSITKKTEGNTIINNTKQVKLGEKIDIQLHDGHLLATINQIVK